MNKNNTVKQAGGFIVQVMPFAEDEVIDQLEKNISEISSGTEMLDEGMSPEDILNVVMKGLDVPVNDTIPAKFYCNCSK